MSDSDAFSPTTAARKHQGSHAGAGPRAKPTSAGRAGSQAYVPTAEERAVIDRLKDRVINKPPVPKWSIVEPQPGRYEVQCDHPDEKVGQALTMAALGISSPETLASVLQSLVDTTMVQSVPDDAAFQRLFSMLVALEPQDEKELMLAVEMVCVHDASMAMSAQVRSAITDEQQAAATDALNKLARTSAQLLETLKRYRSPGQQVIVKRVTVNEGGQAIVGSVGRDSRAASVVEVTGNAVATAPATVANEQPTARAKVSAKAKPKRTPDRQLASSEQAMPPLTLDLEPRREPVPSFLRPEPKINRRPPDGFRRVHKWRR